MRMRFLVLAAAALGMASGLAWFAPAARAERVYLKNGYEIEGWIVEESKAEVVIAIIRRGTVGKITIDPAEIAQIDRTRRESLDEALARYRREMAAEEAARLTPINQTTTAQPAPAPAPAPAAKEAAKAGGEGEAAIPKPTPEQQETIAAGIAGIGDTRTAGGAATRRENALASLVEVGLPALPALTEALSDGNWYRRMNAARAIAEIAPKDTRLALYQEAIPRLVTLLSDSMPFVRTAANHALEAISGQRMGFDENQTDELQPADLAVIDRWRKWWEAAKQGLKS
jgi:hypothetical protein